MQANTNVQSTILTEKRMDIMRRRGRRRRRWEGGGKGGEGGGAGGGGGEVNDGLSAYIDL